MELGNGYGDRIKSLFCSPQFPCIFGEESVVLGIENPYTYLAKTPVIVLQFDLVPFFKIINKTSARTVMGFRERTAFKLKRLTMEVERRAQTELLKEQQGFNVTVGGCINNVIP